MPKDPTLYDGRGNSATFAPRDFAGGGHNQVIQEFGVENERFAVAQYSVVVHGAGLNQGYSAQALNLDHIYPGDTLVLQATPQRPWVPGGWLRVEAEDDQELWIEGRIQSYDPESGDLTVHVGAAGGSGTASAWRLMSQGKAGRSLHWEGQWDGDDNYIHDPWAVVEHNGELYVAPSGTSDPAPPDESDDWIALSFGEQATAAYARSVVGVSVDGGGNGTLTVEREGESALSVDLSHGHTAEELGVEELGLHPVAETGDAQDLGNIATVALTGNLGDMSNRDYDHLTNKPIIVSTDDAYGDPSYEGQVWFKVD